MSQYPNYYIYINKMLPKQHIVLYLVCIISLALSITSIILSTRENFISDDAKQGLIYGLALPLGILLCIALIIAIFTIPSRNLE